MLKNYEGQNKVPRVKTIYKTVETAVDFFFWRQAKK